MTALTTEPVDNFRKRFIISGFIVMMLLHLIFTFAGFYGNDDINYARYAAGVVHNGISFSPAVDQYQLRWVTVYSAAFFYWIFGINTFTSTLSSAISFFFCGILLYKILRHQKTGIYFLSMALFFFARSIIFYSHRLLPDPSICLGVLWMYYSYRSYLLKNDSHLSYGIQFSLALFFAILAKETIVIVLPLFAIFFLRDVLKKRHLKFWKIAISVSFILSSAYLLYFKITTGDFFYRYWVLLKRSYFNECSFDQLPFIFTLKRIGYELWQAMLLNGDFIIFLPGIAAIIYRKKIASTVVEKTDIFSFLILLACANFMTISASSYVPLCHSPRHFLFLFPFAAITGGPMLNAYFKQPAKFVAFPIIFLIGTIVIFGLNGGTTKYLYLFVTVLLVCCYLFSFISDKKTFYVCSVILFSGLLFTNYVIDFVKPLYPYYWDEKEIIQKQFSEKSIRATVFSDGQSAELSEFFLGFETGNLKFLPVDSAKNINEGMLYYLLNGDLNPVFKHKMDSLLKKGAIHIELISRKNNVYLYKINNSILQRLKK